MDKAANISAILLMAGEGKRFGADVPKQFLRLAGKPIYLHTLETFLNSNLFCHIILVVNRNFLEQIKKDTANYPNVKVVAGGATRQESSYFGLLALQDADIVVIHDAVRPFVSKKILEDNIQAATAFGAVDTCIPSADTIVQSTDLRTIKQIPPRHEYLRGQTPQSFRRDLIQEAHERARQETFCATDDCSLIARLGIPLAIVFGEEYNIKITTELDLFLAEQLFRLRKNQVPERHDPLSLKGKIFAVVGGTGGIGAAICQELIQQNALCIPLSRSTNTFLDLTKPDTIAYAFATLHMHYGPLDGLINCAGHLIVKPLQETSDSELDTLLDTNLRGLILCCRHAVLKPGAHLINIASSAYSRGRKNYSIYSCAKAAVVNFTQALADERPDLKIWTLIPQRTDSPMRRMNFPHEDPSILLSPSKIAHTIISILSDATTTGQLVEIRAPASNS